MFAHLCEAVGEIKQSQFIQRQHTVLLRSGPGGNVEGIGPASGGLLTQLEWRQATGNTSYVTWSVKETHAVYADSLKTVYILSGAHDFYEGKLTAHLKVCTRCRKRFCWLLKGPCQNTDHVTAHYEKLIVTLLVNKFCTTHGNRRFIAGFTETRHWSLSWAIWFVLDADFPIYIYVIFLLLFIVLYSFVLYIIYICLYFIFMCAF
jgi:hypothetical protein